LSQERGGRIEILWTGADEGRVERAFIDEMPFVLGFVQTGEAFFEKGFSRLVGSKRINSSKKNLISDSDWSSIGRKRKVERLRFLQDCA